MTDTEFGPLQSFHDVEEALITHLKLWIDAWLCARERFSGLTCGSLARPKSYITKQTFMELPGEDRTPSIIVVSSGFSEKPHMHGDGTFDAYMRMAVAALVHAPETQQARNIAGHYQAAITGILTHKKKFGTARVHEWEGLNLEDIDEDQSRTLAAMRLEFTVMVENFANSKGGPITVPVSPCDPQPDGPIVLTHGEEVGVLP